MSTPSDGAILLTLRVHRVEAVADGIHVFELRHPDGSDLPPFTAGSHISVLVPTGAMRQYSLSNDPRERNRYVIAVKREIGGRGGSIGLIDNVGHGDSLRATAPTNRFPLVGGASRYIFVAGGIGITPILSMLRDLWAQGGKPFHLYYLTRNTSVTAFRAELREAPFAGHVTIHHDDGDPARAFDLWPVFETPDKAHIYCCGPRPLMDSVRDMTGHWPEASRHFEDFGTDLVRPRADDAPFTVRLGRSGVTIAVPVGMSILEALRAHGHRVASSCESGSCGTCRTAVLSGDVDHRDLVLTAAERKGAMMICVSRAGRIGGRAGELVLDL